MTRTRLRSTAAGLVALAMFAVACNTQDHYLVNVNPDKTEVAEALDKAVANIVWVVDNSGSMSDHIENVRKNAGAFTNLIEKMKIEFTMSVMVTHDHQGSIDNYNGAGELLGEPKVLTPRTPNWKKAFVDRFPTQTGNGANEKHMFPVWALLDPGHPDREDFVTRDGHLFLIVVSDTDAETDPIAEEDFVKRLTDFYKPSSIYYYGILCIDNTDCDDEWIQDDISKNRMVKLSKLLQSQLFSKGLDDYTPYLRTIAEKITKLLTTYELRGVPVVRTIKVEVNGEELPKSRENGWSYDATRNVITFHGELAPDQDAEVKVFYQPDHIR